MKRCCLATALCFLSTLLLSAEDSGNFDFFEKEIRPVLVETCYKCHSAEAEKIKGGLLLDTKEDVLKGGDSGPAIVPGNPNESLLIKAIEYKDENLQMPPKKKLSDAQIAAFRKWVELGAADPRTGPTITKAQPSAYDFEAARKQWAFKVPEEPSVPKVKNNFWPKSNLDRFILARLEEKNFKPAALADKRTLIRRATLDLIGIPPTPQEVEAFLKDESSEAFERVVERLLTNPLYGERWGRHWLDVVRYADSGDARGAGSEGDISEAYKYRDWVVKAFNRDLPYDQFILDQFAGDILQPSNPEQIDTDRIVATGLLALGEWGTGDADKDKMMTDIVDDQVDVTGRVFLGLTLACARCHDHKFDPIPNEDYYSLAGIFFSSHIITTPGDKTAGTPVIRIPLASKAELERRKTREERMKELQKTIDSIKDEEINKLAVETLPDTAKYLQAAFAYKERTARPGASALEEIGSEFKLRSQILRRWVDYLGFGEIPLLSNFIRDVAGKAGLFAWKSEADNPSATINTNDKEVEFITIKMPPKTVALHPSPKAGVGVGFKAPVSGRFSIKGRVSDADPNCGDGINWSIGLRRPTGLEIVSSGAFANAGSQEFAQGQDAEKLATINLSEGDFLQFAIEPKGDYSCDTTVIQIEVAELAGQLRTWNLTRDVVSDPYGGGEGNPHADSFGNKGVWSFYDLGKQSQFKDLPADSLLARWLQNANSPATEQTLAQIPMLSEELQSKLLEVQAEKKVSSPRDSIVKGTEGKLFDEFTGARNSFWGALRENKELFQEEPRDKLAAAETELASLRQNVPPKLPVAHGTVEGGVPQSVHAGIKDAHIHIRGRYDRLGPVVPRRMPRILAGDERVPITEGSGRLQLAQWLGSPKNPLTARVMVNRIWQHHFGEGIVRTPNNYGKLGEPPSHPEVLDYLAHRFIDSGWSIKAMHRLIMLSATYQQSTKGDPATVAADPENRFLGRASRQRMDGETLRDSILAVNNSLDLSPGGPSTREVTSRRRTLYLMTIRSIRNDYRSLFDAPDANVITDKRVVSTVAPQALFLLNNVFALGETRRLAERVLNENPRDDRARIDWLYQHLYSRPANSMEVQIGERSLNTIYVTGSGTFIEKELAAWEAYCQVLLASNEFAFID